MHGSVCMADLVQTLNQPAVLSLVMESPYHGKKLKKFGRSLSWDYDDIIIQLLGSQKN